MNGKWIIDTKQAKIHYEEPDTAFEKCFATDSEREQYMYMYSIGNAHYFKNIDTRRYIKVTCKI